MRADQKSPALTGLVLAAQDRSVAIQLGFAVLADWLDGTGFVFGNGLGITLASGHHREILNTAIERLCDFVQPKQDDRIKTIKDLAAGAVLCASLAALIVGGMIVIRHLIR
ncbi:MAG: diacylglycerol kinase [Holdemania filiformis]